MKGKKNSKKKNNGKPAELSAQAQVCPISHLKSLDRWGRTGTDCYTLRVSYEIAFTTDAAGKTIIVLSNLPTGFANWASLVTVFDEYRVLGAHVQLRPIQFNGSLVVQAPVMVLLDRDSASSITSYGQAGQYASATETPGGLAIDRWFNMSGSEDAGFVSTNAPNTTWWIKFFSTGNTVSMDIGRLRVDFFLQFRGLGI